MSEQARRRGESEEERLDRNLGELLQELRVAIPGVQFLFAFLLVVPFQQGWTSITDFEKNVYYVALIATAAAAVCLIGPPARHRLRFRALDKKWIVETSHKYAIAGLGFLGIAITSAILLVSHVVFDNAATSIIATTLVAGMIAWVWFGAALMREIADEHD
jgi:uncharacterized protein DUF6328